MGREAGRDTSRAPTPLRLNPGRSCREILLIPEVLIGREQHLESGCFRCRDQLAILQRGPAELVGGFDKMRCEREAQRCRRALVEQDTHYATAVELRAACSSTARTCSTVTPGNHCTKPCTDAPSSRFSNSAATGTRVPRNTQAPLTREGSLSTAAQLDQSIIGIW